MKPILTVEFTAKTGDYAFKEESVAIHSPEELMAFVAPGGGCERIPDEVDEVRVVFLPPEHINRQNPLADAPALLQLHRVTFTGPLAEIAQTAELVLDKAGRGELSTAFLALMAVPC